MTLQAKAEPAQLWPSTTGTITQILELKSRQSLAFFIFGGGGDVVYVCKAVSTKGFSGKGLNLIPSYSHLVVGK